MQVCERIIESGRTMSRAQRSSSPLMYEWHDKKYLGAAHGLVGILHTLLMVSTSVLMMLIYMTTNLLECSGLILHNTPASATFSTHVCRIFTIAASTMCNSPSVNTRSADSITTFKCRLKSELLKTGGSVHLGQISAITALRFVFFM